MIHNDPHSMLPGKLYYCDGTNRGYIFRFERFEEEKVYCKGFVSIPFKGEGRIETKNNSLHLIHTTQMKNFRIATIDDVALYHEHMPNEHKQDYILI